MEREITVSRLERLEKPGISALSPQDPQIPAWVFGSMENVNADTVIACKKKCHPPFFWTPPTTGKRNRRLFMKLLFKQRLFSWLDSYDIYDEAGNTVYTVKGQLSWGHCLKIFDARNREVGTVKEKIFTWRPQFEMYLGDRYVGCIRKEFTLFRPQFTVDCSGWQVQGEIFEWDYTVLDAALRQVATVSKEVLHWTDTYVLDIADSADALGVLMLVLAIDAEKCSRGNG